MAQQRGRRPVRVEVPTERVEGRIELADIVRRLERTARADARRAKADPQVAQEVEDRLRTVSRLARELARELEHLQAQRGGESAS